MIRPVALGAALLAGFLLAGCATPAVQALRDDPGDLPVRAEVADVPFFPQEDLYCGPAALATVLGWGGLETTQEAMAGQVYTPGRGGTLRTDMLAAARRNGRLAVPVRSLDDVLTEIAAGHPVLVFQNLSLAIAPQWHYAVAVGYDLDESEIVLRSGRDYRLRTGLSTFDRTWNRGDRWALVVLPPDRLPATASERDVLDAGVALERVERPEDAARAYAAALERWPESLGAHVGLGNARYASGDLDGAAAAFRGAVEHHPDAAAAWNNLAFVLAELGERATALEAAETAVRLAADEPAYRETLRRVREG